MVLQKLDKKKPVKTGFFSSEGDLVCKSLSNQQLINAF
jgi:hypothetical protein